MSAKHGPKLQQSQEKESALSSDPHSARAVRVLHLGDTRCFNSTWTDFKSANADWMSKFPEDEPIYSLPKCAIESLAKPRDRRIDSALSSNDFETELAFTALCAAMRFEGMLGNCGIWYPLFEKRATRPDSETIRAAGWSAADELVVGKLFQTADKTRARLLGVVGWLTTEPLFLRELQSLRTQWSALDLSERPPLPLQRPLRSSLATMETMELTEMSIAGGEFVGRLVEFLDRWGLIRLTTFDLPDPQGPMLADFPAAAATSRPANAVQIYLPSHYCVLSEDDLTTQIRDWQRNRLKELNIPTSFAGLSHHEMYGQIFRMIHLERTIRGRFCKGQPRGLVEHIVQAIAATVGIGCDRVRTIRTWINRCRRGERSRIKWLKVKT